MTVDLQLTSPFKNFDKEFYITKLFASLFNLFLYVCMLYNLTRYALYRNRRTSLKKSFEPDQSKI